MIGIKGLSLGLIASGLIGGAAVSQADSVQHETEISVLGAYVLPDDERTDEYGMALRATYGIRLDEYWWVEPTFFSAVMETGQTGQTDYYQQGLGVDVAYRFFGNARFTPFGVIGAGASRNDVADNPASELGGYANFGVGLLSSPLADSGLRLRVEARYLYDSFDNGQSDVQLAAGITVPIGATRRQIVEKVTYVEKPVVVEKTRMVEMPDSDNDGVVDGVDQCPNTLEGLTVDAVGCVKTDEKQSVILLGVTFEFNSNRLTANARDILARTADALKGQDDLNVELAGHTDSVGAAAYNLTLSQQRANAVRDYLIDLGVDPRRLVARGYGESKPIRSNDTEAGRERNRRVEFNVISE